MRTFRFSSGAVFVVLVLALLLCLATTGVSQAAPAEDMHQFCRQAGNDDTIREYSHALYADTVAAFKTLAPDAKGTPEESDFQTQAQYRCMNGKVMVCFVGANLPCVKMNASRDNPGADEYCQGAAEGDFVSAAATGHDAVYSYKCHNGKAEITGTPWELDERGFAKDLWTELPDD